MQTTPSQDPDQPDRDTATLPPTTSRPRLTRPRFMTPSHPETTTSPSPSPDPAADDGDAGTVPMPEPVERPEPRSTRPGSSRASSPADPSVIEEGAAALFGGLTTAAHEYLTRDDLERAYGLYLADEQDLKGISQHTAAIVGRRSGDLGGGNPDVADGIGLVVALVAYLVKQWRTLSELRSIRRQTSTGLQPAIDDGPISP